MSTEATHFQTAVAEGKRPSRSEIMDEIKRLVYLQDEVATLTEFESEDIVELAVDMFPIDIEDLFGMEHPLLGDMNIAETEVVEWFAERIAKLIVDGVVPIIKKMNDEEYP